MKRRELLIRSGGLLLGAAAVPFAVRTPDIKSYSFPIHSSPEGQAVGGPIYFTADNVTDTLRAEIVYAHVFNPATVYRLTDNGWEEVEL